MSQNQRLKFYRESVLGLGQTEIAESVGLKQGTWSEHENGKQPVSENTLIKLNLKYGLNPDWIKTGEGPMINRKSIGDIQPVLDAIAMLQADVDEFKKSIIEPLNRYAKIIDKFTDK